MYNLKVFKLQDKEQDIFNKLTNEVILSKIPARPQINLGYLFYLDKTKNSMKFLDKVENKSIYYVVNPFEHNINTKDSIHKTTVSLLKIDTKKQQIISRAFYKMWEMLYLFDLADKDNIVYAALAEAPGSFLQAVIEYRKFNKKSLSKDRLFGISLHPDKVSQIKMKDQFLGYYNTSENENLVHIHKTYEKSVADKYKSRDNGDITSVKTISLFKKDVKKTKKYADLVTADGGFIWEDENNQEQEAFILIYGEIVGALRVQAEGGHFVLKLFQSFSNLTLKMIRLLMYFYKDVYIFKPFTSRESNSEKYIICKNFKFKQDKKLDTKLKLLEEILEKLDDKERFVYDFLNGIELTKEFINQMIFINLDIVNKQQIMLNKMLSYKDKRNSKKESYIPDKNKFEEEQKLANKYWLDHYYDMKKRISYKKELEERIEYNNKEIKLFTKNLI